MSELKAGVIVTPHDEGMCFNRGSDVIAVTERETEFYLKSEADKVLLHKDRKRCLAMAKLCRSIWSANIFIHEGKDSISAHYMRWEHRWISLADKPTWQRFLQLIHKEAK